MFEQPLELSPDLDWMLQSHQVSTGLLIETIVGDYYVLIKQFALAVLGDPVLAEHVAVETIVSVVMRRDKYWGEISTRGWIYRNAWRICRRIMPGLGFRRALRALVPQSELVSKNNLKTPETMLEADLWMAFDRLKERERVSAILYYVHGFEPTEIGEVLSEPVKKTITPLQRAKEKLNASITSHSMVEGEMEPVIINSLQHRWPREEATETKLAEATELAIGQVEGIGYHHGRRSSILKFVIGAFTVAMVVAIIWFTNISAGKKSLNPLLPEKVVITRIVHVPVYITETPEPQTTPEPLMVDVGHEEIIEKFQESNRRWSNLWIDGMYIYYGPAGYVGPAMVRRDQVWVSQPFNSLVITGQSSGEVDHVWFANNGKVYDVNIKSGRPSLYDFHSHHLPVYSTFSEMIFPASRLSGNLDYIAIDIDQVAGREALIVDEVNDTGQRIARLWVDIYTGVILHNIIFGADGESIAQEKLVRTIVYDVEFPNWVTNRNDLITDFVQDYRGGTPGLQKDIRLSEIEPGSGHVPLQKQLAPEGFDPSQAKLTFQWSHPPIISTFRRYTRESSQPAAQSQSGTIEVFADTYYLGQLEVGNPWETTCGRSPDGRWLVMVENPDQFLAADTRIRYLSVDHLEEVYKLFPDGPRLGSYFAISPDSRHLVFWGCESQQDGCGLYILDFATGESQRLANSGYFSHFAWSPNGNELAMINSDAILMVMRVNTGEIIYEGVVDWQTNSIPMDAPVNAWGVEFPPSRSGFEGCIEPPGNN